MFLTDYDEEKTMQMFKDEAYEDGVEFGLKQGIEQGRQEGITILFNMVRNGKISRETAMEESPDKSKLAELLATLK